MFLFALSTPLAVHADGGAPNLAYVAGGGSGISIIDILQQKVTGSIPLSGDPHTIYLSLDGRFLYVTQPTLGRVSMVSAQTKQTLCSANLPGQPSLLAFDPGTNILYAAGNGASIVTALDSTNCSVKFTIKTQGPVYGLQMALVGVSGPGGGTGNQLWVTDGTSLTIFSQGKELTNVPIPGGPRYLSIPTGITAYVTTQTGDVDAVDLATRHVSRPLITGGTFGPMDYDAYTDEVYVPDSQHNQLYVLNPVTSSSAPLPHEPSNILHLSAPPVSVAITSDGQFGFVGLSDGKVAVIDVPGKQIIDTINVGGSPHFIITGLYPPLIGSTPQQASILGTIINILAYALVAALILVPIILLSRQRAKPKVK
jgi:DNA-binding beta-propeller fold protein YncE